MLKKIILVIVFMILLLFPGIQESKKEFVFPPEEEPDLPRVAIVIDDLGNNFLIEKEIDEIEINLTLAVLPFRDDTQKSLSFFRDKQEIILHLPLDPVSPKHREENMITVDMKEEEIKSKFQAALSEMPFVEGLNNHKGSLFTSKKELMETLLREVKKEDLFFVDSFTIGSSLGYRLAKDMEIKTAKRDVFLDNSRDKEDIKNKLYKVVALAEEKGEATAIGHAFPETIKVLKEQAPTLKDRVQFVHISELTH